MRTRRLLAVAAATLAVLAWTGVPSSAQSPPPATVTVVHGLRGQQVDVYLDDVLTLEGFRPERVTDPLLLEPGEHQVDLRPAGSEAAADPMADGVVTVPPGANMSIVAHLDPDGDPTVSAFVNDLSSLPAGQARLVARNTAATGAITLVVDGGLLPAVAPEKEVASDVAPSTYRVAVESGDGERIVPAEDVPVPEGAATIMYLIGSQRDQSLIWIGQTIDGLQAPPTRVPTGNSGLAADSPGSPPLSFPGLLGLGGVAIALALTSGRLRRPSAARPA